MAGEEATLDKPSGPEASAPATDAAAPSSAPATESPTPAEAAPAAGAAEAPKPEPPKSAYEAVKRVMDASRTAATTEAAPKTEQPATAAPAADSSGVDLTRERIEAAEWRALPEKERQRITAFRNKLKEYGGYVQEMAPKAKTFDDLNAWMTSSGVTQDDFVGGLQILALLRSDPVKAWEALQPVINDLRARIGDSLPPDLSKAVEEGTISEAHAKELALARNERTRLETNARHRDSAELVRQERSNQQAAVENTRRAIEVWETAWRASDPDYAKKAERVWEAMSTAMQTEVNLGKPLTQQRVLEIAKESRTKVERWMTGLVPAAREKTPVTTNGSGAATVKQPSSAFEAAKLAYR